MNDRISLPLVKICGVRGVHHARVAAEAGADMVGLIFAPGRRQVTPDEARAITSAPYARRPRFVGVFVNEDPDTVGRLAGELRLDLVQLSGEESVAACARLRVPYSKVVHVGSGTSVAGLLHLASQHSRAAAIVLDTAGTGAARWGGTGVALDWELAYAVARRLDKPLMLAGGLRPENVAEAIRAVRPWAVDVSSGVETDGAKDDEKIRRFVAAATSAWEDARAVDSL